MVSGFRLVIWLLSLRLGQSYAGDCPVALLRPAAGRDVEERTGRAEPPAACPPPCREAGLTRSPPEAERVLKTVI